MTFDRGAVIWGIVFVALGVVFLFDSLGVYDLRPAVVWPMLLIAIGIGVLAGAGRRAA